MKKIELLAPAGSQDSLIAAVQNGADAVYIGGSMFSARAFAENFDEINIEKAIDYCHLYGVKIYITMNTLIKEKEIKEALDYAVKLYNFGVDGLIVQDTGFSYLLTNLIPELELHASTQMTIHNREGAIFFKNKGFKRIVLSRELSLDEIKYISNDLGVETEIFVHGAQCICYSGQCLMSSILGGRSGNRGRCAQPCRREYSLVNEKKNQIKKAYVLSPKDMCSIYNIKEIIESGTASLKIEGRMKRPEYVAGVVDIYRRVIDSIYTGDSMDYATEEKDLLKLFNREGFSKAYLFGKSGREMMAYNFPKNMGIPLGKVIGDGKVKLIEDIHKGDGIRIGMSEEGFIAEKIILGDKIVEKAHKQEEIVLKPLKFNAEDVLYKTYDTELFSKLNKSYEKPFNRKINIPLSVDFKINEEFELKAEYNGEQYIVKGPSIEKALNKPIAKEKLIENLSKSSDTPFKFYPIEINQFEEGFLSLSEINSLRRNLIDKIEENQKIKRDFSIHKDYPKINWSKDKVLPKELICVSNEAQLRAAQDNQFENIGVPIELYFKGCYLRVSNIVKSEFEVVCDIIENKLCDIKGIVTSNIGIINRFKNKTKIIGDYKLNLTNSFSINMFNECISGSSLSLELNKKEISDMVKGNSNCYEMLVYGKPELMVSEHCVVGSIVNKSCRGRVSDNKCNFNGYYLKDIKEELFSIYSDSYCRTHIYNNVPINLIHNLKEIKEMGITNFRLDFIDEDYEGVLKVLNDFKEMKSMADYNNYTRGHFKRGVE